MLIRISTTAFRVELTELELTVSENLGSTQVQRWATPTPELELTPELEFFTRSWSGVGVDFLIRNGVGVELP